MGEWFIEQKAKRYKLKQSASLAAIKDGTLFDKKAEKKTLSFHANETVGVETPSENSLLIITCEVNGNAKLMRGLEEVGHFGSRETERIKGYMRDHAEYGGIMPVRLDHVSLDGGMDVTPVV